MSDDNERRDIRRFGRKDQKKELKSDGKLLPEQGDAMDMDDAAPDPITFDDLEALVEANKDLITPAEEPWIEQPPPRPVHTPPAERFPPIPQQPISPQSAPKHDTAPAQSTGKRKRRRLVGNWRHDVIAFIFFVATLGLIWYFSVIWRDPYSSLNPLAKPTPFVLVSVTPDPEAVTNYFATQTAEARRPSDATPIPQNSIFPFIVLENSVIYAPNANGNGCDWASIAGTVTGLESQPLNNYRINIVDAEDPSNLDVNVFSGSALTFGDGGFELPLGGSPIARDYEVQLLSPSGAPVSEPFTVSTRDSCDENVVIINFQQIRPL